ncbi:MAG: HAD-IIIC family phosphatase, partial [Bacteroidota bacterium]|nr:HAD-IIIC family phosphatase [Bacteroidota bacterium]
QNNSPVIVPIGRPVSNTSVYIANKSCELTPINVAGEIYIGGMQVARGYLNLLELTAEKFIENPFAHQPHSRLYRTGDVGRWMADGNIEYLGRIDDQVKIRGYRIEPGEIESVMQQTGLVKQAVVVAKSVGDSTKSMVAYVVPKDNYTRQAVIASLEQKLPAYMVPAIWVELEALPLTATGKIDKKALPNTDAVQVAHEYVAPRNEVEVTLASIWSELLGVSQVGITDNFFELGGHSLKAIQSISRIHKALNVKTDIGTILGNPTIEKLSQALKKDGLSQFEGIPKVEVRDHYELSHAQKRFWILSQFQDGLTAYNGVGAFTIDGDLDIDAFRLAFHCMIERHESIRTIFIEIEGQPKQKIIPSENFQFDMEIVDLRGNETRADIIDELIQKETQHRFNLAIAPLLRCSLLHIDKSKYVVVFNIHHIISDGWSKAIFITEFLELYKQTITTGGAGLQPLLIQYKDYAAWHTSTFAKQGKYWKNLYREGIPILHFPADFDRPKIVSYNGGIIEKDVDGVLYEQLKKFAIEHSITLNNLLFSLYAMLVAKYSQQQQVVIGALSSGRSHSDLENLIGVFINFLPVKVSTNSDDSLMKYLEQARDSLTHAFGHQDYPFDLMVEELVSQRDISRNPFFDTMINFHPVVGETRAVNGNASVENRLVIKPLKVNDKSVFQSVLDFKVDVEFAGDGLVLNLSYNKNLYSNYRMVTFIDHYIQLLKEVVDHPDKLLREYLENEMKDLPPVVDENKLAKEDHLSVNVCASFIAEPLQEYMEYWSNELELNLQISFAPYNQVFQQLLNPASLLNSNKGINVLFIRVEDWLRDKLNLSQNEQIEFLDKNYEELVQAIQKTGIITSTPFLVGVVPVQSANSFAAAVTAHITELTTNIQSVLQKQHSFHTIDLYNIAKLYEVAEMFDTISDNQGHMPFTPEFYGALATYVTRKIRAFKDPPYKVIALDCDNTLWSGIVGEVGTAGVVIDENFSYLQEFLIKKYEEGFLLVLCSKNNEDDVWEVFDKHRGMKLKREHIAAHKINWQPKAENVVLLAKELNLGVDSFIFLDDNEFEVEQMQSACPTVYSIQLPDETEGIPGFLDHIWAFDVFKLTEEDLKRNSMYKAENDRKSELLKFGSISDFIEALNIEVITRPLQEKDLDRAVQLSLRTNQFNLNGVRKTRDEIVANMKNSLYIQWIVEVKDRFGEYGIVGLLIGSKAENELQIETFLLSCRVLGRQVENIILTRLRDFCVAERLSSIAALYQSTGKNKPFTEFLGQTDWVDNQQTNTFRLLIKYSERELLYTNNEKQLS